MPSIAAKEEVSQLAKSPKHIGFSEAYSPHLEGRSQSVGVGFPVMKIPGENRQLNFAPVSVSSMGVDVASCMLGVRVSPLPCAVIEEYASAARYLISAGWIPLKIKAAKVLCLLCMGYLPTVGLLQPPTVPFPFEL